jgi:GAF domain-containing protein/anti-sigma regulatory factor (Ser/Thr protein kinase)
VRRIDVRTLESLHRMTDAALAYMSEDDLLQELLQRISEIMEIDTVAILLLEGETLRARAAKGIEEEVEQGVRIPIGGGFAGRIAAERRPIVIPDVDHADILNPILREKGIRSLLGVPLLVEGRVIGVLHVGSLAARDFTPDETALLQLAADRAALAIEHGRMFARERLARQTAEQASARLQAVQRVTDAALAYLTEEQLLQELLHRISEILDVDTVAFLLLEGDAVHARAAKGIEEEVEQNVRVPLGRGFAGRVAAERRPIIIPNLDHADIFNPILRQKGIRSLLGVPLLVEGRVVGVLHVGSLTPREFTADDTALLQLAADRAALAIEHARLYEQRRVAEVLQRRLMPTGGHAGMGLEISGRYLPASGASLGGDWYDAFQVTGGRIALTVGDVVGHGIEAAAVMAQLRTAVRAYAADGYPAAGVVDRVNQLMMGLGPNAMTTLAYLVLDPSEETVEVVNAGHPPPLILDASGTATFLGESGGVPLGAMPTAAYDSQTVPLPTGAIVFLYTDGLVERRREPLDAGLQRLRDAAAGFDDVERLCAAVVDRVVPEAPADDIAFIAARVPPLGDRVEARWPARPDSLAAVRQVLRRWLRGLGAGDREAYDIVVACQEACANAIEHAYGPGDAEFEIDARLEGSSVRIAVRDRGRWRRPRGEDRGRGLAMMRALMDTVDVRRSGDGTEVVLGRALERAS